MANTLKLVAGCLHLRQREIDFLFAHGVRQNQLMKLAKSMGKHVAPVRPHRFNDIETVQTRRFNRRFLR